MLHNMHIEHKPLKLYNAINYRIVKKAPVPVFTIDEQLNDLRQKYPITNMRRTVEGLLLVHHCWMPHVMMLQTQNEPYTLPGGVLQLFESEVDGLQRYLNAYLSGSNDISSNWNIKHIFTSWWRPQFGPDLYPFEVPKSKERRRVYFVELPENKTFVIPENYKFEAVSFKQLHENVDKHGEMLSSLPWLTSFFGLQLL